MDDDYVENNMANDDLDSGTGTYDDLRVDNDIDVSSEPNIMPDTDGVSDDANVEGNGSAVGNTTSVAYTYGNDNMTDNNTTQTSLGNQANGNYEDPDLWPADRLKAKMGENMATAEALTDENPLRTENTPNDNENE